MEIPTLYLNIGPVVETIVLTSALMIKSVIYKTRMELMKMGCEEEDY